MFIFYLLKEYRHSRFFVFLLSKNSKKKGNLMFFIRFPFPHATHSVGNDEFMVKYLHNSKPVEFDPFKK